MNYQEWLDKYGVKVSMTKWERINGRVKLLNRAPEWVKKEPWMGVHATGTVASEYGSIVIDYWGGPAHTGRPDAEGFMDAVANDAHVGRFDLLEFMDELGYNDSRKARKAHDMCTKIGERLRAILHDDAINDLIYNIEWEV